ncbi:MAG: rhamnulokinase [bacterium]|nr:rhamnulokinase [bacterium]
MAALSTYLAFDLGASSGRALAGRFDGSRISLEEIHRFPNGGVPVGKSLYWDALRLFDDMRQGLRACIQAHGPHLMGIGIDTWGVDFALLDKHGELLNNPICYRDPRVHGVMDRVFQTIPRGEIFERTGLQFMEFNTLYQLAAMVEQQSPQLPIAHTFLMMPDLFNFWFTGRKVCEFSDATTTQFYNPREHTWATDLLDRLNIPTAMLPEIVPSGTSLGPVRPELAEELGLKSGEVIAPACHDTGSAVAAVPMQNPNALYISCGTWALMGTELPEPAISQAVLDRNFTNEGGVCNTFRFLKNISGLWLVQECRRIWQRDGSTYSFEDLVQRAGQTQPFLSFVDPDHPDFVSPGDMPARIREACKRTGQPVPESEGAIIRCALESLALKFRYTLGQLEEALDKQMSVLHMVGGGIQNTLLCQFTANATGLPVIAGPVEATALGNILVQAMARGQLGSLSDIRDVVRNSTELISYEPAETAPWEDAYGRFLRLLGT